MSIQPAARSSLNAYEKLNFSEKLDCYKIPIQENSLSFAEDVRQSLNQANKYINQKYLYNKEGSAIFEEISKLEEYYVYRVELALLTKIQNEISLFFPEGSNLVEMGSGSSIKTKILIDALHRNNKIFSYIPIDISETLIQEASKLAKQYPNLKISAVITDYETALANLTNVNQSSSFIISLGTSLGNLSTEECKNFFKNLERSLQPGDCFFFGIDLVKDRTIILKAYNDSKGLTAKFNLNILRRINSDLNANFDVGAFSYEARYCERTHCVNMFLKSHKLQKISIKKSDIEIILEPGEEIHTERSQKYTTNSIKNMLKFTKLKLLSNWIDDENSYGFFLLVKDC